MELLETIVKRKHSTKAARDRRSICFLSCFPFLEAVQRRAAAPAEIPAAVAADAFGAPPTPVLKQDIKQAMPPQADTDPKVPAPAAATAEAPAPAAATAEVPAPSPTKPPAIKPVMPGGRKKSKNNKKKKKGNKKK